MIKEKNKGIFTALAFFALFLLVVLDIGIIKLTNSKFFSAKYITTFNIILTGIVIFLAGTILFLLMAFLFNWKSPFFSLTRKIYLKLLFPIIIFSGRILNIPKERIQQSLIEVNNSLVKLKADKVRPDEILLLLPHCLQKSDCTVKLSNNLINCAGCGGCAIKELCSIGINQKIKLALAKGGTEARKVIEEIKPKAVIAVACERDLISGIIDSYPISVFGIVNERPFGYCKDTCINLIAIKEGIEIFLQGDRSAF